MVAMETSGRIWPNFKLIQALIHVLITCKYEKDPIKTRTVRGSDYSPAIELSEQKDKLVTATGDTEKYSEKVWLNSVYWFSRY